MKIFNRYLNIKIYGLEEEFGLEFYQYRDVKCCKRKFSGLGRIYRMRRVGRLGSYFEEEMFGRVGLMDWRLRSYCLRVKIKISRLRCYKNEGKRGLGSRKE